MKESTARIGDTHDNDRTVSECFPCRWPEINYNNYKCYFINFFFIPPCFMQQVASYHRLQSI